MPLHYIVMVYILQYKINKIHFHGGIKNMRIKLYDNNENEKVFNTENNNFLSALKEIYSSCDDSVKECFFKSVTGENLETKTITSTTDGLNKAKDFFKVKSISDLDLFSIKIGTGVIACKAKILPETTERETAIGVNAAIAMSVYKKLESESKVYGMDYIDIAQLTRDCASISIECVNTCKEHGWTKNVTDFIERELLEKYGVKWEV